jgi:hypothetical protein
VVDEEEKDASFSVEADAIIDYHHRHTVPTYYPHGEFKRPPTASWQPSKAKLGTSQ